MNLKRNYDSPYLKNSTNLINPVRTNERNSEQYEALLEYDLKRQKQKNIILEQRLKNKQIFIQQMKHFQEQLTATYQKCKISLDEAQKRIEYLENVELRQQLEQISELKHLLMKKNQEDIKRNSFSQEGARTLNSLKNKINRTNSDKMLIVKQSVEKKQFNPQFKQDEDPVLKDIASNWKKSANFISHFLQMAKIYIKDLEKQDKFTHKLKKCWKWIKDVVKEWDSLKRKEEEMRSTNKKQDQRLLLTPDN